IVAKSSIALAMGSGWVIMVFTTLSPYYFSAAITFANIFKAKEFKIFAPLLFPWIYFLSMMLE
uniref:hypothetical protein n=1 Tax=Citrobacter youngae TaxID=133448 RepID=UPI001954AA60